jgi:hypothetical protein
MNIFYLFSHKVASKGVGETRKMNSSLYPKVNKLVDWQPGGIAVTIDIDEEGHVFFSLVRPIGAAPEVCAEFSRYSALSLAEVLLPCECGEIATSKRRVNGYFSRRLRYVQHQQQTEQKAAVEVTWSPSMPR